MRSLEHVSFMVLRALAAPASESRLLRNFPNRWARILALLAATGVVVLSPHIVTADLLDGLVGYWSFDNSGNLGQDKSGNGYAGTAQGNASFLSGGVLGGGAMNLDGSGDFMQLPNMASNFSNSASLSVWINLNNATPSDGSRTGFMDFDNGSNSHYPWVSGTMYMGLFRNDGGRFDNISLNAGVDRGNWHLMTVVSDPTEGYKIYQNDIQVFSTSQPGFGVEGFRLGTQNGYWLDGQIDEAGLWNRALTASDVSALYNGGAGLNFFLSAGPTLFWNGTSGNWADDVWLNDVPTVGLNQNTHPQNVSSVVNPAVITEGTVSVTSDQQAYSLNMDTGSGGSGGRPGNGTLNINGGTLLVRTDTTISNTSSVNISTGATLETTGILAVGAGTTFSSSGTVNADTLAGSGTVTLNTGGSLNVGSGGSLGAMNVAGNASLGGAGSVSLGQLSLAADKTLTKMGAGSATLTQLTLAGNATIDVSGSGAVTTWVVIWRINTA